MTEAGRTTIVARMDFAWFALYALGAVVAFYILTIAAIVIIAALKDRGDSVGRVRYVSGETIVLPPEPEKPRKRWRITIERV